MIVKKEKKFTKYIKYILLFVFLVLAFLFRKHVVNYFLIISTKIHRQETETELTLTEREELNQLRIENKILKDENEKVRSEFSVGLIDETKAPVYMLLGESTFYGDFYVSMPSNKTPYKGMNIFSEGNIVVGQVEEILKNSMKVSRLGQSRSFIAEVEESEESLELQSLGSGLYVGSVSGGSKISLGDTVVMKGYPKAIVGTVVEVAKGNTSLSNIFVRTPYNVNNREIFYVIQ